MQLDPQFMLRIHDLYGEGGTDWLSTIPQIVAQLEKRWDFEFISPMTELSYNFIALVHSRKSDQQCILKVSPPQADMVREVSCLQHFKRLTPSIYAVSEEQSAFLMEYLQPADTLESLVKLGRDDEATHILCSIVQNLQNISPGNQTFQAIGTLEPVFNELDGQLEEVYLEKAKSLFKTLIDTSEVTIVLHGDLHHGNILRSGNAWKIIDPHAYAGDPVFEIGTMIYNPIVAFPNDRTLSETIERRLDILAKDLPFNPIRIQHWAYCKTALSLAWTYQAYKYLPDHELEVLKALHQIIR